MGECSGGPAVAITRPRSDSEAVARELQARGYRCVVTPLLEVRGVAGWTCDLEGVQAVLVTSRNAAPALAKLATSLPVFAVGDATAEAAGQHHDGPVASAGGDGSALSSLIRSALDPQAGALLHLAGEDVRPEPGRSLKRAGFEVRRQVVYRTRPVTHLPPELLAELRAGTLRAVLFFSPRTAGTFRELIEADGLDGMLATIDALCLSEAVAHALGDLTFRGRAIAPVPQRGALLGLLDGVV